MIGLFVETVITLNIVMVHRRPERRTFRIRINKSSLLTRILLFIYFWFGYFFFNMNVIQSYESFFFFLLLMDNPHFISFVNLLFADDDQLLHVGTDFFIYIFIAESTSDLLPLLIKNMKTHLRRQRHKKCRSWI